MPGRTPTRPTTGTVRRSRRASACNATTRRPRASARRCGPVDGRRRVRPAPTAAGADGASATALQPPPHLPRCRLRADPRCRQYVVQRHRLDLDAVARVEEPMAPKGVVADRLGARVQGSAASTSVRRRVSCAVYSSAAWRRTRGRWRNSSGGARREVPRAEGRLAAPCRRLHPDAPRVRPRPVKHHLTAIRMLGDWLVVSQVLPVNPAAAVRGPKHVVTKGATPVLSPAEARKLLGVDRHGRPGGAPGPGAPLGHALQLRAGERGVGDAAAGLLRAGEPGPVEAPREGREAARRAGPPPGGRDPRRLRRSRGGVG